MFYSEVEKRCEAGIINWNELEKSIRSENYCLSSSFKAFTSANSRLEVATPG